MAHQERKKIMKTWKKVVLGISLISVFLGGGLAIWGYSHGALTDLQNQPKNDLDFVKKEVNDFNRMDIKSNSYNILIKTGNVSKATITYYQKKKNPIDITVKERQLSINENYSDKSLTSHNHFNLFGLKDLINLSTLNESNTIIITLPKNQTIDFLKADLASGNLDLNNSTIKQSNIDLKVGDLTFTEMTVNNLEAHLAVGSVESNDTLFANSDLSIALGDYTGNNLVFNGHNKLDVTSGDVEISLKNHTVNVQADSHSGETEITNNLKNSKDNTLTITSDLGDIYIE
ncbi:MAG: DUF4097 family beta strand repeat protein [Streptococcus sp.]|nr:DUF4097 family beta strand repeat protein [Streptococcus sp.]